MSTHTTPRIVILDGYTLNPGDNPWDAFTALGELTVYDRTPAAQILERSKDAEILLTNKTPLSAGTIEQLPALRYIGVLATGTNVVDSAAAKLRGIVVTNVPGYGTESVAQHAFALILELARHVGSHAASVAAGDWSRSEDWCYWNQPLVELTGLNLGIIGYGSIGKAVAHIGRAFGMNILATTRSPRDPEPDVTYLPLAEVLNQSDIVSLHCPLTKETEAMVDARWIGMMKPTAFLINTGRGQLINEAELAEALCEGRIAGAALDVLGVEPPAADNPLISAPRCLITPHNAWASLAARMRLKETAADNLRAFLSGRPVNVVG